MVVKVGKMLRQKFKKGGRVDSVEPSKHEQNTAFVTVLRYQLGDWSPYIYKTTNYGEAWKLITDGIPSDFPVRVVREDPNKKGLLYAGTEFEYLFKKWWRKLGIISTKSSNYSHN